MGSWTGTQLLEQTAHLADAATVRVQFGIGPLQLVERIRLLEDKPFGRASVFSICLYTEKQTRRARPFTLSLLRQLQSQRGLPITVRTPDKDGEVKGVSHLKAENVLVLHCTEKVS